MFRPIRKKKNEISVDKAKALLHSSRRGVLAVNGDDGYPYAIPINYLYDEENEKIIFHGAKAGHKVDALKKNDKICFTVFGNETVKEEAWAPFLQSAVVFGRCHLVESQEDAIALVKKFAAKYYPNMDMVNEEAALSGRAVQMFEIEIEHLSGKEVQER
jgi:nitroimidazol reductase NimA-like FMN-containing flavoprotein (pyridoxamine 5'-phosphate oxidase superfamily)